MVVDVNLNTDNQDFTESLCGNLLYQPWQLTVPT